MIGVWSSTATTAKGRVSMSTATRPFRSEAPSAANRDPFTREGPVVSMAASQADGGQAERSDHPHREEGGRRNEEYWADAGLNVCPL